MNALVLGLLAKKAEDRHGSAVELAEDLRRVRDGLLPLGVGPVGTQRGAATRIDVQATVPMPLAAAMNKGRKWTKAPLILTVAFTLFALLLGGSGWSLLHSWQGQDLVPNQEDSQGFAPAFDPENEASTETEQAPSVEVAAVKEPTQITAPSSAALEGTSLMQVSPSSTALDSSTFTSAPVNTTASLEPQPALEPAPTQQAQAEVAEQGQQAQAQQAQVQVASSQMSSGRDSGAYKISGTQRGQPIGQVKPPH
jgi:hypothetical protein